MKRKINKVKDMVKTANHFGDLKVGDKCLIRIPHMKFPQCWTEKVISGEVQRTVEKGRFGHKDTFEIAADQMVNSNEFEVHPHSVSVKKLLDDSVECAKRLKDEIDVEVAKIRKQLESK